jgi:N-acetylmuramoyl-L-alanine amidase
MSRRPPWAWLLVAALAAVGTAVPGAAQPPQGGDSAPVAAVDGKPCLSASDMARLLGATQYWRSDVRKLTLRTGSHTIKLTAENPFVLVDERAFLLPGSVRMVEGQLMVPVAFFDMAWPDSLRPQVRVDTNLGRVIRLAEPATRGAAQLASGAGITRLVLRVSDPTAVRVAARGRSSFRLRFPGPFGAAIPDSLPRGSLIESMRARPWAPGSALELQVSRAAAAYRLVPDPAAHTLTLEIAAAPSGDPSWQPFALELPPGPRPLRSIVIDPGHGGDDDGVTIEGGPREKDLTLALARALREELSRRIRARVILTRENDANVPLAARVEAANRARADIVLCLHFDGFPRREATGATAYVPPAVFGAGYGGASGAGGAAPLVLVPWRDAATRFAVTSRELAENLLDAFERHGLGPTRLREHLPYGLVGVNAPGVLLECGTLTSPQDRQRVSSAAGLRELASAIAAGLQSYQRLDAIR